MRLALALLLAVALAHAEDDAAKPKIEDKIRIEVSGMDNVEWAGMGGAPANAKDVTLTAALIEQQTRDVSGLLKDTLAGKPHDKRTITIVTINKEGEETATHRYNACALARYVFPRLDRRSKGLLTETLTFRPDPPRDGRKLVRPPPRRKFRVRKRGVAPKVAVRDFRVDVEGLAGADDAIAAVTVDDLVFLPRFKPGKITFTTLHGGKKFGAWWKEKTAKRTLTLTLLDRQGKRGRVYTFKGCLPHRWDVPAERFVVSVGSVAVTE